MSHISNDSVIDSVRDMNRLEKLEFLAKHLEIKKVNSLLTDEKLSEIVLEIKLNTSEQD